MIFLELFLTFFKIGAFTFGGGYAMLPLIQETVAEHGWLSESELVDFIAVSESTPGPFAINVSTYVGMETGGILGALCATLGVVTPSFAVILIVAKCYEKFKSSLAVTGCMNGLKPVVIGLIGAAVISTGKTVFFPNGFDSTLFTEPSLWISIGIFAIALILSLKKINPILVIIISAILGIVTGFTAIIN